MADQPIPDLVNRIIHMPDKNKIQAKLEERMLGSVPEYTFGGRTLKDIALENGLTEGQLKDRILERRDLTSAYATLVSLRDVVKKTGGLQKIGAFPEYVAAQLAIYGAERIFNDMYADIHGLYPVSLEGRIAYTA